MTDEYHGQKFFVRQAPTPGRRMRLVATPLFVVLVLVETTDLIFAVDSIPAIFAVTDDPFIVYTSNVFAILGLRALYFLLAGVIHRFHYLKLGLSVVLVFVGAKMLLTDIYQVPVGVSLAVIALVLGAVRGGVARLAEGGRGALPGRARSAGAGNWGSGTGRGGRGRPGVVAHRGAPPPGGPGGRFTRAPPDRFHPRRGPGQPPAPAQLTPARDGSTIRWPQSRSQRLTCGASALAGTCGEGRGV